MLDFGSYYLYENFWNFAVLSKAFINEQEIGYWKNFIFFFVYYIEPVVGVHALETMERFHSDVRCERFRNYFY